MLDKMRLRAQGKLPADYKTTGTDLRVCGFLRVEYDDLLQFVLAGATDEEALKWCFTQGRKPEDEEILCSMPSCQNEDGAIIKPRNWSR